jgi:large subunit ribosomal protein L25
MSDALTLPAEARERAGKGASRQLRREGRIPAVIYGGKEDPVMIHVEEKELVRQLGTGHFMNSIVSIEIGGKTLRTLRRAPRLKSTCPWSSSTKKRAPVSRRAAF